MNRHRRRLASGRASGGPERWPWLFVVLACLPVPCVARAESSEAKGHAAELTQKAKELARALAPGASGAQKTIEQTMDQLDQLRNVYLQAKKDCSTKYSETCETTTREVELELVRGTYNQLERLKRAGFQSHLEAVRKTLMVGAVGLDSNLLELMHKRGLASRDVVDLYELRQRFTDPEFVEKLKKYAAEREAPCASGHTCIKEAVERLDDNPGAVVDVLLDMKYIEMRQELDKLLELKPDHRRAAKADTATRLLLVVERPDSTGDARLVVEEFANGLAAILTAWTHEGIYHARILCA